MGRPCQKQSSDSFLLESNFEITRGCDDSNISRCWIVCSSCGPELVYVFCTYMLLLWWLRLCVSEPPPPPFFFLVLDFVAIPFYVNYYNKFSEKFLSLIFIISFWLNLRIWRLGVEVLNKPVWPVTDDRTLPRHHPHTCWDAFWYGSGPVPVTISIKYISLAIAPAKTDYPTFSKHNRACWIAVWRDTPLLDCQFRSETAHFLLQKVLTVEVGKGGWNLYKHISPNERLLWQAEELKTASS